MNLEQDIYLAARPRDNTVVACTWANVVAGAGFVKSSAGSSTAWIDVIEPCVVEVKHLQLQLVDRPQYNEQNPRVHRLVLLLNNILVLPFSEAVMSSSFPFIEVE